MRTLLLFLVMVGSCYGTLTRSPTGCVTHPCTLTVTCASATCTSTEVTEAKTAVAEAQCSDTVKLQAGRIFHVTGSSQRLTFDQRCAMDTPVTLESTAMASLPDPGTRITPAYTPLMPNVDMAATNPAISVRTQSPPAHGIVIRGIYLTNSVSTAYGILYVGDTLSAANIPDSGYIPYDVVVDRCVVLGGETLAYNRRPIMVNSAGFTLKNSWTNNIMRELNTEGNVILTTHSHGHRSFNLINNWISGGTENVMQGGTGCSWASGCEQGGEQAFNFIGKIQAQNWLFRWSSGIYVMKGRHVRGANQKVSVALNSGTTGGTEPTWPASIGGTVSDNGITWRLVSNTGQRGWYKNIWESKNSKDQWIHHNVFGPMWIGDDNHYYQVVVKCTNCLTNSGGSCLCAPRLTGYVNTSGTTVTWVSGDPLPETHAPEVSYGPSPYLININGIDYTISDFTRDVPSTVTLSSSAGTHSNVPFTYGWLSSNGRPCVAAWTWNIRFEHNVFRHGPVGFYAAAWYTAQRDHTYGIYFDNNLTEDMDNDVWSEWTGNDGPAESEFIGISDAPAGMFIRHNTEVNGNNAWSPEMNSGTTAHTTWWWGDTVMTDNLLEKGTSGGFKNQNSSPSTSEGDPSIDRALCNGATCTSSQWDENLIAGVNTALYTRGNTYNLCSSAAACAVNWDYDDPTYGRLFEDFSNGKYIVRDGHIRQRGGTDGRDLGADFLDLPLILDDEVVPLDDKVLFRYNVTAPISEIPCVFEISTSKDMSSVISDVDPTLYTRPDTDHRDDFLVDGNRRMFVAGLNSPLSASTTYYYRQECGGDQKWEKGDGSFYSFTTVGTLSGTIPLVRQFKVQQSNAATCELLTGTSYSRSVDTIGSVTTTSSACASGDRVELSTDVSRGDIVWNRIRVKDSVGSVLWTEPVRVQAIQ